MKKKFYYVKETLNVGCSINFLALKKEKDKIESEPKMQKDDDLLDF